MLSGNESSLRHQQTAINNTSNSSQTSGGPAVYRHTSNDKKLSTMASPLPPGPINTDLLTQRAILEQLLMKRPVEGDFWFVIVSEWLEQLKRYIGIPTSRKFYHQRSHPGPVITRRDYAHTVDVVQEDAWRMIVQWYGLADGHKPMKLVVYSYNKIPEIEHNINSFKVSTSESPLEDFHNVRFSKMEKVGHIEYKIRELYRIPKTKSTRLWGKPDCDAHWKPLFCRDKAIGKVLDLDSDFTRSIINLEICDDDGQWNHSPDELPSLQDDPSGPMYENNIFDDITSTWEIEIHEQIDHIGKSFLENLHINFSSFVQRAKEYVDERDYNIREREREINLREVYIDELRNRLEEKERKLDCEIDVCRNQMKEYDIKKQEMEKEYSEKLTDLEKTILTRKTELDREKEMFESERGNFHTELQRMCDLYKIQESKIKLDIGGHQYTTSLSTLTREDNSMLSAMFSGRHELKVEKDGSYFIDRDGVHFRYILNYLRDGGIKDGTLPMNENLWRELLTEAEYFQINGLVDYLSALLYKKEGSHCSTDTFV